MILVDYSQVALANILSFPKELKSGNVDEVKDLIRHCVLSTLKYYKKKYTKEYGEMIICCDSRKYWRKDYFQYYKAGRKKSREESEFDWKVIFDTLSEIRQDLEDNFPYKVIHIEKCEADDIIACLASLTEEFGHHQKVMVISSDHDFIQLQENLDVKQWSPRQKKLVTVNKAELKRKIIEHIVKGDSGDGIPNILSNDDVMITDGERQKPVSKKRLEEFFEKGREACRNDFERRNWDRNETLVSFKQIPGEIRDTIVKTYLSYKVKGDKMSVFTYLIKNKCRLLLKEVEEF